MSVLEVVFLYGAIAAPPCTLPKEHSNTTTQYSLWRQGGNARAFFLEDPVQQLPVLCQEIIRRQGHNTALGGNARDFFLDYFSS